MTSNVCFSFICCLNKFTEVPGADSNTFYFLSALLDPTTTSENNFLFVVGAYRDNEVATSHLLSLTLREIERRGGRFVDILLPPLNESQVEQMLDDTFNTHTRGIDCSFIIFLCNLIHKYS